MMRILILAMVGMLLMLSGCSKDTTSADLPAGAAVEQPVDDKPKNAPDFGNDPLVAEQGMQVIAVDVQGMTCAGCATSVYDELMALKGVEKARVSVKNHTAWIIAAESAVPEADALVKAVEAAGYEGHIKQ